MVCVGFTGALGDRVGRRLLLMLTLIGFGACLLGFSLVGGLAAMVAIRVAYGCASSLHTASVPPKFVEYPAEASRGKFMALTMVTLNLSGMVLVGYVAARLPSWFHLTGMDIVASGRSAMWAVGGVALVLAVATRLFMMPDKRLPKANAGERRSFIAGYRELFAYGRTNPNFGLLIVTALVIRTDVAVLQSFLSLWVVTSARGEGIGTLAALKIVGTLTAIQSACSIVIPLVLGPILDRANRAPIYAGSVGFVGIALLSTMLVDNVTSWPIYAVVVFIGIGEAAQTISQQAFFGQEAPPHLRGTAYGMLAVMGTVSVVLVSLIGGQLFDKLGPTGPFMLSGWLHVIVIGGSMIYFRLRGRAMRSARLAAQLQEAPGTAG
jgi:MFS family permease